MGRPTTVQLEWRGPQVHGATLEAAAAGVEETLEACVEQAKADRSWGDISGEAAASIEHTGAETGRGGVNGRWGSFGDPYYFPFLEEGTSSIEADNTLRRAADAIYPSLPDRIRAAMP